MSLFYPRTCVDPSGHFVTAVHKPSYSVPNLRFSAHKTILGHTTSGSVVDNRLNYPEGDVVVHSGKWVFEVPNPFPFWGATYILQGPAEALSHNPARFRLRRHETRGPAGALLNALMKGQIAGDEGQRYTMADLPRPVLLALAQTCNDPELLASIASLACDLEMDGDGRPTGLLFSDDTHGHPGPSIHDHDLFETLGNNPALPDPYKRAMVLTPGAQGTSPIVGEFDRDETHIWEYLRANSYIPWGHYASNMAHDQVRYQVGDLSAMDMHGLRHLYYQRVYVQMAQSLGLDCPMPEEGPSLGPDTLEALRNDIVRAVTDRSASEQALPFTGTMWGWNYGYDFSSSGYRLHASHQQIHQQFALIPPYASAIGQEGSAQRVPTYAVGDQVAQFCLLYRMAHGVPFFDAYLRAIQGNRRLDGQETAPSSLILYEDDRVLIHVPKAQRCQGELQITTKGPVGHVLEAGQETRDALDAAIRRVVQTLAKLGAEMITCYEVSKRFDNPDPDQRLFYCFLPRHPQSPGAFSERQERWVTGHFPEDYAEACRASLASLEVHRGK